MSQTISLSNATPQSVTLANAVQQSVGVSNSQEVHVVDMDYEDAENKPKIEGVELVGDKTASAFGLVKTTDLTAHTGRVDNPHSVTATQVGLGNVDNTADADKPVSTATQTALTNEATARASADTALQDDLDEHAEDSTIHVTASDKAAWTAKYDKPATGIPKTDLASAVQASLDLADTALQAHQDITGKADLVDGKVPASQLPSYVDDVLEFSSLENFPATGEDGKIYVAEDTNKTYRWSGTAYIVISEGVVIGETASTAFAGSRGVAVETGLSSHTSNSDIHVTASNKTTWDGKLDAPASGTAGQVLTKTASGTAWSDAATIDDTTTSASKVWSSSKVDSELDGKMDSVDVLEEDTEFTISGLVDYDEFVRYTDTSAFDSLLQNVETYAPTGQVIELVGTDIDAESILSDAPTWGDSFVAVNAVSTIPSTGTASGIAGQMAFDSDYLYVCISENTWKKIALTDI